MNHYIYIIYAKTIDKHYVGYSKDPWVRVIQHNNNSRDKYTGRAKDWILAAVFSVVDEHVAIRRIVIFDTTHLMWSNKHSAIRLKRDGGGYW